MAKNKIQLKVVESLADDAYKGIARVDSEIMRELGIKRGDVILIKGNRETVAIADRAYPADVGEGIIRIDGILRRNAKTGIGDVVEISKVEVKEARKIIIAPAQKGVMVQADNPNSLRNGLLGRTLVKGDIVVLGGVQRRRDLFSEMGMDEEIGGLFGDMFNNLGMGNLGGGITQIRFVVVNTSPNHPVIITENTEVALNPKAVDISEEKIPEITYEDIGGLEDEIKKIREMVEIPMKHPEIFEKLGVEPPKGVLLHGPPGTGKTLLAKAVANETDANFILLNGPEVMSKFYGESEKKIRDLFEEAEKTAPTIIFIDELDAIAPKREDVQGEVERRVVSQILTMMDGLKNRGKVIVIGATNRVNAIDSALRRPGRFDREIEVGVPDKKGRRTILGIHTRGMPLNKSVNLDEIASITHGFVGADLEALAKEAAMGVLRKWLPKMKLDGEEQIPQEILEKLIIKQEDFTDALKTVRPSAMREVLVEIPNVTWEDVGGLENVKQELKEAVEWPLKYPEGFARLGIRPSRGILLYGPPGTGKTLIAKAVAKEAEANFIQVKGPSLLSMWVGKSLPYNEEIMVRVNGAVKRMKIGEVVENKLDVEVLAFDKNKKISFTPVDDHIKHKLNERLLEITTRTGRKIIVTDYHSLFSFVNGKLTDVPASYLIPGESYIATPKNINLPKERLKQINLYNNFKDSEDIFVSNVSAYLIKSKKILGLEKTAGLIGVSKKYLADIISKKLPISIRSFDCVVNEAGLSIDFSSLKIKLKGSVHEYPMIFNLDKDFWRLMGIWIAEGDFNDYGIRISNQNKDIRKDISNICGKYGFKITETNEGIIINSLFLQKVFKEVFGLKTGAKNKGLPSMLFTLDKETKANLLRGYFSGDGSIYAAERGKFVIEASTISKQLADDLMYLLLDFGIVATCYTKKLKNGNFVYRIMVMGVKNFESFKDIGFIDVFRNKRILEYIQSRMWSRSDLIPLSGDLYDLASNQLGVYSTNNSIGKEKLKQMLVYLNKDRIKYKEYWDLVEGDIYFDLVKDVKILGSEEHVYDVSVPAGQNFVGGFGGVIAHNSEEGMRKVFERARQVAPCIIFFDEIDALAGKRGVEQGTKVTERVLNQMLAEMDGLEDLNDVLVIGATNRPDMLDSGLLRPGRFDKILLVTTPEEKGRQKILEIHTKKMPLGITQKDVKEFDKMFAEIKINDKSVSDKIISKMASDKPINDTDLKKPKTKDNLINFKSLSDRQKLLYYLAHKTEGYSGADIEALAREAAMLALREDKEAKEVKKEHFEEALGKIKPSVTKSTIDVYKRVEENFLKKAKAAIPSDNTYFG